MTDQKNCEDKSMWIGSRRSSRSHLTAPSPARAPLRRRAGAMAVALGTLAASMMFVVAPTPALAAGNAIIPNSSFAGFTDTVLPANDDGSSPLTPFNFSINYFGTKDTGAYVNNNGNLTFSAALSTFTPFGLGSTNTPIIAPFFADVDTNQGNLVDYGTGTLNGFKVFVANWPGVECYPANNTSVLDYFQVVLIDRPDLGTGALGDSFQMEFNFNSIQWDAGTASGGNSNCTNSPNANAAAVGYSDGTSTPGHFFQLPGSQTTGGFLDSNAPTGLIHHEVNSSAASSVPPSASPVLGRYIFNVVNGQPQAPTTLSTSLSGGGQTGASITVNPSTAVTDSATLSGANVATAGGTVTYNVYSDNACTVSAGSGGTVTVTNGSVPVSSPVTLASVGTYYWQATYSGDASNAASTSGCTEVETVRVPPATTTATVVDDAASSSAWNGAEVTGASAFDTSTVSGFPGFTPTGTVTYSFFTNGTCAGAASTTNTVTLSAGAVPNSSATAALGARSYSFQAAYSGDSTYSGSTSSCESFTVAKASASPGTVVYDAALGSAWNGNEATGASAYDTAAVTGIGGFTPTGTMTYSFFANGSCAGAPSTTNTVTLSGGNVPNSTTTGALAAGSYGFTAAYSGDGNYLAATPACEPFTVLKSPSGVGTVVHDAAGGGAWNGSETLGASAYDAATVTSVLGFTPTGTLTYSFYANGTCAGAPSTTNTVTLSGGNVPNSTNTSALAAGSYSFKGSYSGDGNYLAASGSCEPFAVGKSSSSLGTVVDDASTNTPWSGTETVGAAAYDTATVGAVGGFTPTGTVTYNFFTNGTCSGSPATTATVTLSGGNVPNSASTGALTSGPHGFAASYSGDGNYQATTAACEPFTVFQAPAISSANATTFTTGHPGTFTVTTTGYPTGASMHISDGAASLPSGVSFADNGDSTATLSGTPGAGTGGPYAFTITAANGIAPAATQSFTLTVDRPPAITSANGKTFTTGAFGTFTVASNGFPGAGTMTLSDGGATLPTGVTFVDNGDETATLSGTPGAGTGGTYAFTITASNGVAPDATQAFTLTVDQPPTVTSANNVSFAIGAASSFTVTTAGFPAGATVSISDGGAVLPSGVTFVDNGNGTASLAGIPAIGTIGSYPFTITVANGIAPNGTQAFTLTVGVAGTTTVLSSPTNPSVAGQSVTLVAAVAVTPPSSGSPTGTVSFIDGVNPIAGCATRPLSSGTATCTTTFTSAGAHALTAVYSGDANFATSTSGPLTQTVGATATTTTTAPSANPAVTGQSVVYTVTVSRTAPATGTAGGTVAFTDAGNSITGCAAVTVTAGTATCTVTYTMPGAHSIIATYSGDTNDLTSVAPALAEQVAKDPTVTTVTSSPNPSAAGQVVAITVTVKAALPGSGNPTGTVTIYVDGAAVATVALDSTVDSRAVFSTASLSVGTHAITATYNGDAGYSSSSAAVAAVSQTVVARAPVPYTGSGRDGWAPITALLLLMDGLVLVAWSRRRSRSKPS